MYRPFPLFIGLRYTRARRRNHFISFITVISLLGIVLGVTALITVLSVMNGFHKEVRSRILGMASHAEILSVRGGITGWRDAIATAKSDRRVVGAAPFVESQVMLVNGQNVSGAILRGVLPAQEPEVSDVGEHMARACGRVLKADAGSGRRCHVHFGDADIREGGIRRLVNPAGCGSGDGDVFNLHVGQLTG